MSQPFSVERLPWLDDPDPMVRFQLAFSLGEVKNDPRVLEALATIAAKDATSEWTRTAVLSSIAGMPLAFLDVMTKRPGFFGSGSAQVWIDELAFLTGCGRKPGDAKEFLERLRLAGATSGSLMRALLALGRGQARRGGSFESLVAGDSLPQAARLLSEAAGLAASKVAVDDRLAAIRLLGLGDPKKAREVLQELLDAREPTAVQLGALQAMAGFLDRSAAGEILDRWKAMSPSVRREAAEVLFSRPAGIEVLLGAIESRSLAIIGDRPGPLAAVGDPCEPGIPRPCAEDTGEQARCHRGIERKSWPAIGRQSRWRATASEAARFLRRFVRRVIKPRAAGSTLVRTWRR